MERLEEREQPVDRQMWDAADPKRVPGAHRTLRRVNRELHVREHLARLLREDAPRLGELHHAARPLEELHAELGLELANRLRQRRLRDVELPGRTAEMELLAHREEVAQVPELDREPGPRLVVVISLCVRSTHAAPNSAPSAGLTAANLHTRRIR